MVRWVAFEKLCLAEFLSCHAITILAGTALAMHMDGGEELSPRILWGLIIGYFILGAAAYLFHRNHRALLGFYAILVTRSLGVLSLNTADEDMLKAELVKNFFMFFPTMLLVGLVAFGRDGDNWHDSFIKGSPGTAEKFSKGRNLLLVTGFYLMWAVVAWKWPRG
jgi:hypothetical protein